MAPIALTMGDPAGIGGEITVGAWRRLRKAGANDPTAPVFVAIDCAARLTTLGADVAVISSPQKARDVFLRALPVLDTPLSAPVSPGVPTASGARAAIQSIEKAVALASAGDVSAIVTNPIHKNALRELADFAYPGHTEFLAALANAPRVVMMLASPMLRVVPATIHIPLAQVASTLSADLLQSVIRITHHGLRQDFGVSRPRIAIAGLNPHAGEDGMLGREELDLIVPALAPLKAKGVDLIGPLSADTLFHAAARARYDAAICMYHDQALIPIKALDFERGVNVTLGLPFVRASPDHGVAFDIAGQGRASPESLIAALRLAAEMASRRTAATGDISGGEDG